MGTAHVLMHRELLSKLFAEDFNSEIRVLELKSFGEGGLYNVLVESHLLPDGYSGQKELFLTRGLQFKRDHDT